MVRYHNKHVLSQYVGEGFTTILAEDLTPILQPGLKTQQIMDFLSQVDPIIHHLTRGHLVHLQACTQLTAQCIRNQQCTTQ